MIKGGGFLEGREREIRQKLEGDRRDAPFIIYHVSRRNNM